MKIGVIVPLHSYKEEFKKLREFGISVCQFNAWDSSATLTEELALEVRAEAEKQGIEISAVWRGWSGPAVWDFIKGPSTLGLVPKRFREDRVYDLKVGSDFAKVLGVKRIVTHMGFLPENPTNRTFKEVVATIKEVAEYCLANGQELLFETGQETPITLLRTIETVGTGNLGINLDPANLIMYGKANPVDALDVFGKYVMEVHGKDGVYPSCGDCLGAEMKIGDGKVDFKALLSTLKSLGYDGNVIIEREISGDEQIRDILHAKEYFENILEAI